jgi:hypothetical protein
MGTKTVEEKIVVMNRLPPGDRWYIGLDTTTVYNSMTEAMEEYFQRTGTTEFYVSAKNGTISSIDKKEVEDIKPVQRYSLYGEN